MAKVNTVFMGPGPLNYAMLAPLFPNLPKSMWRKLAGQQQVDKLPMAMEPGKQSLVILTDASMSRVPLGWMDLRMGFGDTIIYIKDGEASLYHRDLGHVPETMKMAEGKPFARASVEAY